MGGALVGLAERGDPAIVDHHLLEKWEGDEISSLSLQASEKTADVRLLPELLEFEKELEPTDDKWFVHRLGEAIKTCRPKG